MKENWSGIHIMVSLIIVSCCYGVCSSLARTLPLCTCKSKANFLECTPRCDTSLRAPPNVRYGLSSVVAFRKQSLD